MGTMSPSVVLANGEKLTGQKVTVEGTLLNQGTNYFTDRRLVVTDAGGQSRMALPVKAWVASEIPSPPAGQGTSPPVLSQYIGRKVILEGIIKEDNLRGFGKVKYLDVVSGRVVD